MIPLIFFTVIPLFTAFLVSLLGKHVKRSSEISASIATFILLLLSLSFIKPIAVNKLIIYKINGWPAPLGILLSADGLTLLMLITVNLIAFLVTLYSTSYIRQYTDEWKFYSLYLFMLAGLNGVIISADIFNLYVFLEIASISGYILVAYGGQAEGLEAAFKYAIMGSLASLFILLGIGMLYSYVSTLNMADIATALSMKPRGLLTGFISVLFFAGFGLKAALIPFHAWLPDAHSSAPSPVSATLSGIVIKTIGVYALIRVFFNIIGVTSNLLLVLMVLGIVSMVIGAILALAQNDIKRMFAYSSISQIGYIIFAFGVGTPLALLGGLFHIFNHACFKSLLFLNAGSIERACGTRDLRKLGGLNSKLPVTGITSLIGSMSISGIPPLAGFWSKLLIIIASVNAGYFAFAFIAALTSIITLVYYLKFQTFAFTGNLSETLEDVKEPAFSMKLAMVILSLICILAGVFFIPVLKPILQMGVEALAGSWAR